MTDEFGDFDKPDDTDTTDTTDSDLPRGDDGELLPPLNADKVPAPPALSSSYGEEVPRDA